jgi:hypothetical protein
MIRLIENNHSANLPPEHCEFNEGVHFLPSNNVDIIDALFLQQDSIDLTVGDITLKDAKTSICHLDVVVRQTISLDAMFFCKGKMTAKALRKILFKKLCSLRRQESFANEGKEKKISIILDTLIDLGASYILIDLRKKNNYKNSETIKKVTTLKKCIFFLLFESKKTNENWSVLLSNWLFPSGKATAFRCLLLFSSCLFSALLALGCMYLKNGSPSLGKAFLLISTTPLLFFYLSTPQSIYSKNKSGPTFSSKFSVSCFCLFGFFLGVIISYLFSKKVLESLSLASLSISCILMFFWPLLVRR